MRHDAREETWNQIELTLEDDSIITGYIDECRVDRNTIPKGMNFYELADDNDGDPCRLKGAILVNFLGAFITPEKLEIPEGESLYIKDHNYTDDYNLSMKELIEENNIEIKCPIYFEED